MTRAPLAVAVGVALLAGCATQPSPSSPAAAATSTPSLDVSPGRAFSGADILAAMRDSRRPGGVPDQLETDAVAEAVAAEIWTIDGEPWTTITIGGSCGPVRCTLDVGGRHAGAAGEDVWSFEVIPETAVVAVLEASLGSIPADVAEAADAAARAADARIDGAGLMLTAVRWAGGDEPSTFDLSYRSGDEEGSCQLEIRLDAARGALETVSAESC